MSATYLVDGVPLDDPDGRWLLLEDTAFGSGASRSVSLISVPGMDGALPGPSSMQPMGLALKMDVLGSSDAELARNLSAVTSLLSASSMTVTRVVDGVETTATAVADSVSSPTYYAGAFVCRFTATLRLPGVFWRGRTAPWNVPAPVSGTSYTVSSLDDSTAPVDDALVLIDGPVVNPKVSCGAQWFALDLSLAEGESALVDVARWKIWAGEGVTFAGGGTVKTGVLTPSGGPYLLRLMPSMVVCDPTVTRVQVALTYDSGSPALSILAAPAFLA